MFGIIILYYSLLSLRLLRPLLLFSRSTFTRFQKLFLLFRAREKRVKKLKRIDNNLRPLYNLAIVGATKPTTSSILKSRCNNSNYLHYTKAHLFTSTPNVLSPKMPATAKRQRKEIQRVKGDRKNFKSNPFAKKARHNRLHSHRIKTKKYEILFETTFNEIRISSWPDVRARGRKKE